MDLLGLNEIINIVLFILPGYIVLYIVNILTDYLFEKNTLDRIIHYLIFSALSYSLSYISVYAAFIGSSMISVFLGISKQNQYIGMTMSDFIKSNSTLIIILSFVYALVLGFVLGKEYFCKGYPYSHFKKLTNKKFTPSAYADILKEYKQGCWLTLHIKDNSVVQGKLIQMDRDEDERDYNFIIKDAIKYYPEKKKRAKLEGDKIVINSKNTNLVEFNK